MSQINVNVVAPSGYPGPNLPGDNDNVEIIDVNGDVVFKYENAAGHVKIGAGITSSASITGSVSIGNQSMSNCGFNTNGPAVAIGPESLMNGVSSGSNIAIGWRSLFNADGATGINNQAIGVFSGSNLTTGGNNIIIGHNAQAATATTSNSITLGNSSHNVLRCQVTSITSLSDVRDKKEIEELPVGLDFVKGLKPVKFVWDDRDENGNHDVKDFGFIAQDLKKSQEDANLADTLKLVYEENPEKLEASYGKLIPVLVKAIQELTAKVEALEAK